MTWNHRVMKRVYKHDDGTTEVEHAIYEVFYDDAGRVEGWTENAMAPVSFEGVDSLRTTLEWMLEALDKPALDYDADTKSVIN